MTISPNRGIITGEGSVDEMDGVDFEIKKARIQRIVKSNEIIQKARYDLNIRELKVMSYIFSMIRPDDQMGKTYSFSINDYCKICGVDSGNGGNYADIRKHLKCLRDKSFWLTLPDGSETTVGWLSKVTMSKKTGKVIIELDSEIQKYVIGTFDTYTQYELLSMLPMRSQYAFRIYELLKSYAYQRKHRFTIDDLKRQLAAEHYVNFKDFRKKVLEIAINEINEYTDLETSWEPETKGRKVVAVTFTIKQRDSWGRLESSLRAEAALDKNLDEK